MASSDDLHDKIERCLMVLCEVKSAIARLEERSDDFRASHASAREASTALATRVSAIERHLAWVQAWSAGAGVVLTAILGAAWWLVSRVPDRVWHVITGG
jgi:hypothetical protein